MHYWCALYLWMAVANMSCTIHTIQILHPVLVKHVLLHSTLYVKRLPLQQHLRVLAPIITTALTIGHC